MRHLGTKIGTTRIAKHKLGDADAHDPNKTRYHPVRASTSAVPSFRKAMLDRKPSGMSRPHTSSGLLQRWRPASKVRRRPRWLTRLLALALMFTLSLGTRLMFRMQTNVFPREGRPSSAAARTRRALARDEVQLRWDLDGIAPAFNLTSPLDEYRVIHVHSSIEDDAPQTDGDHAQRYLSTAYSLTSEPELHRARPAWLPSALNLSTVQ